MVIAVKLEYVRQRPARAWSGAPRGQWLRELSTTSDVELAQEAGKCSAQPFSPLICTHRRLAALPPASQATIWRPVARRHRELAHRFGFVTAELSMITMSPGRRGARSWACDAGGSAASLRCVHINGRKRHEQNTCGLLREFNVDVVDQLAQPLAAGAPDLRGPDAGAHIPASRL